MLDRLLRTQLETAVRHYEFTTVAIRELQAMLVVLDASGIGSVVPDLAAALSPLDLCILHRKTVLDLRTIVSQCDPKYHVGFSAKSLALLAERLDIALSAPKV